MRFRGMMIVGFGLLYVHYLVFSTHALAFALPELGLLLLVVGYRSFHWQPLLAIGVTFGYVADNFGATEKGSLLVAYVVATAALIALDRIQIESERLRSLTALGVAFIVFHGSLAILVSPVFLRSWLGVVVSQLIVAIVFIFLHGHAQKMWSPRR